MSVVAITGVSGYLGQSLLSQLDLDDEVEAIVGVDRELLSCPPPDKLTFVQHDLTKPLGDLFSDHGVTHAIHVATTSVREHEADAGLDLTIVGNVLDACGAAGARSVCVASSVIVYGAHPDNTILLEGSIVRPNPELPAAATKLALEERCYDFVKAFPETALQIVRPCPILGPSARGVFTRLLDAPRIYGPWRVDPRFQFVHEDDATRAIHRLVKSESFGVFNLAGDGSLTLSQIAQLAERRLVRLPSFLLRFAAWLAWRLGKTDLHPGLLPFLLHPWLVAAVKVRNSAYFVPRYDSADALLSYLEHRDRREPEPLEPFEWSAPTPAVKPAPAGDFGQRPGLDAEDRAKTKPLGRPPEGLSPADDTPDPDPEESPADAQAQDAEVPDAEGAGDEPEVAPASVEAEAETGASAEGAQEPEAAEEKGEEPETTEEPTEPQPAEEPQTAEVPADEPDEEPDETADEPETAEPSDEPLTADERPDEPEEPEAADEPETAEPSDEPLTADERPDEPDEEPEEPEAADEPETDEPETDEPLTADERPDEPDEEPAEPEAADEPETDEPEVADAAGEAEPDETGEPTATAATEGEEEATLDDSEPAREEGA
jgi:UDP-glucose 4-epimerase